MENMPWYGFIPLFKYIATEWGRQSFTMPKYIISKLYHAKRHKNRKVVCVCVCANWIIMLAIIFIPFDFNVSYSEINFRVEYII